jgi:hypothetical protein
VPRLARVLFEHCTRYLSPKCAQAFFKAIGEVLEAHIEEIHFLRGPHAGSLPTYLGIRRRTIALNPFFEVIKCEYLAEEDWELNAAWMALQNEVSRVAGLQNDLIGLVRDLEDGEQLNAVMVLMRGFRGCSEGKVDHDILSRCVALVNAEHNQSISRCLEYMTQLNREAEASGVSAIDRVEKVARHILMMCETHLRWCSSAKRYRLEVDIDGRLPEVAPGVEQQSQPPQSRLADNQLVQTQSVRDGPATPARTVIRSSGNFHGLPTFPNTHDCRNMTALVTGATGVSGFQMVKVLAGSPKRWSKIYCLSFRPPPDNFFADLGECASRVEHLAVDFLDDPCKIADLIDSMMQHVYVRSLPQNVIMQGLISQRDHVFYFSYIQPSPKGDTLDLWSNADELATLNGTFTRLLSSPLTT